GWFWIPGRVFGPAWVSWASASDYLSWCPLGFDDRPVFSFSVGVGSWLGWTVVPRASFGFREHYVNRYAITGDRLPRTAAFITHSAPPAAFSRSGVRIAVGSDPRSSFRRRDDVLDRSRGAAGGVVAPNAAASSRRRDIGDPRTSAGPTPSAGVDPGRPGRG